VLSESDFRSLAHLFWQIVDYRSRFTATHTSGVAAVAGFLAPLAGIVGAAGRRVSIAAGLHDIGKLAVPCETLDTERALSSEEQALMRNHPLNGWRVLRRVPGLEDINQWANFHHERLDGSGYPFHIPAERIPIESRVVAVSDVFTALTEERPYRRGMSGREALTVLQGMADSGALDHDLVALMADHREEAAVIRRLAQEGASERYVAFREHTPEHGAEPFAS
jgi:HD-GYP domain-containing protein (c-di-GMP phosphodiesterase class II)